MLGFPIYLLDDLNVFDITLAVEVLLRFNLFEMTIKNKTEIRNYLTLLNGLNV